MPVWNGVWRYQQWWPCAYLWCRWAYREKDNFDIECPKSDYKTLWTILADYPKAFATLAHPENTDFQNLLNGPYNKDADKALCGVCIMSGPAFAEDTDYSSKPAKSTVDYFRKMLAIGYHVGPLLYWPNP
jgi:trimeric autotransporter adhesin